MIVHARVLVKVGRRREQGHTAVPNDLASSATCVVASSSCRRSGERSGKYAEKDEDCWQELHREFGEDLAL
jgi:hypothetical protein